MTYTVRNDVGVTLQRALGVSVLGLVAGEVPDDEGLVAAGGEEHVGAGSSTWLETDDVGEKGHRFGVVRTYFSMEVARLVTQPFYTTSR